MARTISALIFIGMTGSSLNALAHQHETLDSSRENRPNSHGHPHHHHGGHVGHWMAPAREAKRRNPVRADNPSISRGKELFQMFCASCHGDEGEGNGPMARSMALKPTNLQAMAPLHADGDLAWKIAQGRGPMPGWKASLRPNQIWDLVNYIKHIKTPQ